MSRLDDVGLTLGDVDLGETDAESDYKLAQDFVRTAYVDEALTGKGFVFIGRKGSGKSALFKRLPSLSDEVSGPTVMSIPQEHFAWTALNAFKSQGVTADQARTSAWQLTIAVEAALGLMDLGREWPNHCITPIGNLRKFIESNFGRVRTRGINVSGSWADGVDSVDLSAFGVGFGLRRRTLERQPLTPQVTELVLAELAAPVAANPIIVQLDRLDDSWDGTEEAKSHLVGLLKAAKTLNDHFRDDQNRPLLRVLVFLRTEIYESLRFDDKDKFRTYEVPIQWKKNGLRDLLTERLPTSVTIDELFDDTQIKRQRPVDYVLSRTFLRPREVLQFITLCLKTAPRTETELTGADVVASESTFSDWKVKDLKQENSKSDPMFEELLESLREKAHRYESLDDLGGMIALAAPVAVRTLGRQACLELLFQNSVIGIRPGSTGATRFVSSHPSQQLSTSGPIYVHPALHKGLGLRYRSKKAGGASQDGWLDEDDDPREPDL